MNSKEIKILKETSMGEMLKAYSAILKIKVAFIKYEFNPETVNQDDMIEQIKLNLLDKPEAIAAMIVSMNDLLCDIYDICEESEVNYDKG